MFTLISIVLVAIVFGFVYLWSTGLESKRNSIHDKKLRDFLALRAIDVEIQKGVIFDSITTATRCGYHSTLSGQLIGCGATGNRTSLEQANINRAKKGLKLI